MKNNFLNQFPKILDRKILDYSLIKKRNNFISNILENNKSFKSSLTFNADYTFKNLLNYVEKNSIDFKLDSFFVEDGVITRVYYKNNDKLILNEFLIKHTLEDLNNERKKYNNVVIYKKYSPLLDYKIDQNTIIEKDIFFNILKDHMKIIKLDDCNYYVSEDIIYNLKTLFPKISFNDLKKSINITNESDNVIIKKSDNLYNSELFVDEHDLREVLIKKKLNSDNIEKKYNFSVKKYIDSPYMSDICEVTTYNSDDLYFFDIVSEKYKVSLHLNDKFLTFSLTQRPFFNNELFLNNYYITYDDHFSNGMNLKINFEEINFNFVLDENFDILPVSNVFFEKKSKNLNFDKSFISNEGIEVISLMTDLKKENLSELKDIFLLFQPLIQSIKKMYRLIPVSELNYSVFDNFNKEASLSILKIMSEYHEAENNLKVKNQVGIKNGK